MFDLLLKIFIFLTFLILLLALIWSCSICIFVHLTSVTSFKPGSSSRVHASKLKTCQLFQITVKWGTNKHTQMARQSHINYDVDLATGVKLERDDWSKSTNEIIEKVSIAQLKHCHLKFAHHCFSRISIWTPRLATWCNLTWHIVTTPQ